MPRSLPFPREHGAWGMLLVPPVVTALALGTWPAHLWLFVACACSLFMARTSLEALFHLDPRLTGTAAVPRADALSGLALWGGVAAVCGLPLVSHFGIAWTLAVALVAGLLSTAYFALLSHYGRKTLGGEFFGVALLTLTAPAAAYLLVHDAMLALRFWLIHYLFFLSGLLYVKVKLEARKSNAALSSFEERLARGWPVLVYHVVLAAFILAMARERWIPGAAALAFAPVVARAFWGVLRWDRRLSLSQLGRSELLHSLVFALLMGLAYQIESLIH